jgi:hypothetical protein
VGEAGRKGQRNEGHENEGRSREGVENVLLWSKVSMTWFMMLLRRQGARQGVRVTGQGNHCRVAEDDREFKERGTII